MHLQIQKADEMCQSIKTEAVFTKTEMHNA